MMYDYKLNLIVRTPRACPWEQSDKDMEHVSYYGFGPEENYIDRNKGAILGRYNYNVTDNCTPYLYPQECGNRTHAKVKS